MSELTDNFHGRFVMLQIANFFQGFILWYTIEKLFMRRIGFDDAGIGLMVAAYSAIMLLVETPSGILADRWSRKGVLMVASVALSLSGLVGGLSHDVPMYLLAAGLWGIFFALYSGTYDSILYDLLLETKGHSKSYERYYGYVKVVDSLALVLGSLIGGLVAAKFGLRQPYFWTVPLALVPIGVLALFHEPQLHKAHAVVPLVQHVRRTFGSVLKRGHVLLILTVLVCISALSYGLFEFSQLWWIALALPVSLFGPFNGALLATIGLGGLAASRFKLHRPRRLQALAALMLLAAVLLGLWRAPVPVLICQVMVTTGAIAVSVVFNRWLHDALPSQVRAGASSAVNTLTRVVLIPVSLLFGVLSRHGTAFEASWMLVVLVLAAAAAILRMTTNRTHMAAVTTTDETNVESYQK